MKNLIKRLFGTKKNSEQLMILYDPIEDTEKFKKIADEVDKKVVEIIGPNLGDGYCHVFWTTKKQILKEEYGIDWKSPAEMNMNITFD